jgi:tetratricopeptide (TPR) repeat protein
MRYDIALAERDNFRAALDWAEEHDPQLGLAMAVELEQFWVSRDVFEALRRFTALFERVEGLPPELEARALRVYGGVTAVSGDQAGSRALSKRSLSIYEELGDEFGIVNLRHRLAVSSVIEGDVVGAQPVLEENLRRARETGNRMLETEAVSTLGNVEYVLGNLDAAIAYMRLGVELSAELGFLWFLAIGWSNLAEWECEAGNLDAAETAGRRAIEVCREIDDARLGASALASLAVVARRRGDARRAGKLLGAVEVEQERGQMGWNADDTKRLGEQAASGGGEEFETGRAAGRKLSLVDAYELALAT